MAERVPDSREDYPVQRWFGVEPPESQQSELSLLEQRITELEKAYGLKFFQTGEDFLAGTRPTTVPHTSPLTPSDVGSPEIGVYVSSESSLVLVFYEIGLWNTGAYTGDFYVYLHDDVTSADVLVGQFHDLPTGFSSIHVPERTSWASAANVGGVRPRGTQIMICNYPTGDHIFSLRYAYNGFSGQAGTIYDQYLTLDVV